MILKRASIGLSGFAIVCGLIVAAGPAARGGPSVTRYASPTGTTDVTSTCPASAPCSIANAVDNGPAGETVIVMPGTYTQGEAPIPYQLTNTSFPANGGAITIKGQDPAHPPVIKTVSPEGIYLINGSTLSDIVMISTGTTDGIDIVGGTVSHVAIYNSAGAVGACALYNTSMVDSLCVETGAGKYAIRTGADDSLALSGVTAAAIGAGGIGLGAGANSPNTYHVVVDNTILSGAGNDLELDEASGATLDITLNHSAYRPATVITTGTPTVTDAGGNVTSAVHFKGSGTTKFAEAADSPTIDKGEQAKPADTDLANHPRTLGGHTDIGAYEFLAPPKLKHLTLVKKTKISATFEVNANAEGLATKVRAIAKSKHHTYKSPKVALAAKAHKTLTLKITGLPKHTKFVGHATAKNSGGTTTAGHVKFHT